MRRFHLFLFFLAVYALTSSGNAFRVPDEFEVYFQTEHLVDAGDLSVPQTLAIHQDGAPIFFGEFGRDGRPYAPYGPGVAFLIVPFHMLGRAVAAFAGVPRAPLPDGIAWEFLVGGITSLGMAFAAALAVAGFHRASIALGASPRTALQLSAIVGLATMLWPYGTSLYSEAWLAAAFVWAAAFLLEARNDGPSARSRVLAAAALLAVAGLTKPTALVIAPGFIVATLLDTRVALRPRWRATIVLAGGIALAAVVQIGWNLHRFARPLDFGYNLSGMILQPPARSFSFADVPRGLLVQLLTPGKSLFVWAPIALVTLLTARVWAPRDRGLAAGLLTGTALALVFYAAFLYPDGGYAHGPRHLLPLVPLLVLPLAIPAVPVPRRAVMAAAAAGFVIAALAASVSFLEDQSPFQTDPHATGPYYERIDPEPGRPWNRYRLDYIPFKAALTSGHWASPTRAVGNGPDFFALHLLRARTSMPGGTAIPIWLPWTLVLFWATLGLFAGLRLLGGDVSTQRHDDPHQGHQEHKVH